MTIGYLSITLQYFQFPSSVFQNFQSQVFHQFVSSCFTPFMLLLKETVFQLLLFDSSLSVCKKATDFCILILILQVYCIHLLVLIAFLTETLAFSLYSIKPSARTVSLLPICMLSFSYLTAVARTSNTMLNRSGESGPPCRPPDFFFLFGRASQLVGSQFSNQGLNLAPGSESAKS